MGTTKNDFLILKYIKNTILVMREISKQLRRSFSRFPHHYLMVHKPARVCIRARHYSIGLGKQPLRARSSRT